MRTAEERFPVLCSPLFGTVDKLSFLPGWREKTLAAMTQSEADQLFAELDACIGVRGRPN